MKEQQPPYLPHLEPELVKEGFGHKTTSFLIALEAWRRGLTITLYDKSFRKYSVASKERVHFFNKGRIDLTPKTAVEICIDKNKTKEYLKEAGVATPEGRHFGSRATDEEIVAYGSALGFPIVLKPIDSSRGKGVIVDINDEETLRDNLKYVRDELALKEVIIERYISGDDYRIYVIEDRVVAASKRKPANILGNGKSTIRELIDEKNEMRRKVPSLSKGLIRMDKEVMDYIKRGGYSPEDVLEKGKTLFLRGKGNFSAGGEPVDVTETVPEHFKEEAVKARAAIPGLRQCGIDFMVKPDFQEIHVIEINSRAQIGGHVYPAVGKPRDIPSEILDTYFPESIGMKDSPVKKTKLVFDYKRSIRPIEEGVAATVTLMHAPKFKPIFRRFMVSGEVQGVGFRRWVKKQAQDLRIHGNVKNLEDGTVKVVAAGSRKNVELLRKRIEQTKVFNVLKVEESVYRFKVKIGFKTI